MLGGTKQVCSAVVRIFDAFDELGADEGVDLPAGDGAVLAVSARSDSPAAQLDDVAEHEGLGAGEGYPLGTGGQFAVQPGAAGRGEEGFQGAVHVLKGVFAALGAWRVRRAGRGRPVVCRSCG